MVANTIFFLLCLAVASLAYPTLPIDSKKSNVEEGHTKDLSLLDTDFGPLGVVSKVLDRYARQIVSKSNTPKKWTPLHRAVLRGALQVTKQLLGYDSWTPNHLELLKGEQEILLEHVTDDQGEIEDRVGKGDKEKAINGEAGKSDAGDENAGATLDNGGANNEEAAPESPPSDQA